MRMKKIEAVIRPERLNAVRAALEKLGYPGMSITEVRGCGKQAQTQQWRGMQYEVSLLPRLKIEIVVIDDDVSRMMNAITKNGRTGQPGDGKIFILPVEAAVRIRTGDKDDNAI